MSVEATPVIPEPQLSAGEQLAAALNTEAPTEPIKTLADKVKEFGFADVKDDNDAQERLLAAYQEQAAQAKQAIQRAQELEELARLRAEVTPAKPAPVQDAAAGWWNPPKVDEVALRVYSNPDGTLKDSAPESLKQEVMQFEAYRKKWAASLIDSPDQALRPAIEAEVKRLLAEQMQALEAKTSEEAITQKFIREADWAFQVDPVTKTRRKDHMGNFIPSPEGVKFGEYMEAAAELGITSRAGQLQYATEKRELDLLKASAGQITAAQTTQQINDQKKQELLRRALPGTSQAGTFTQPGQPPRSQNRNLTAGQKLVDQMRQDGALSPN